MKTSEKLYNAGITTFVYETNLNRQISYKWIAMKKIPTEQEIILINKLIEECIKEVRELEEKNE